MLAVESIGSRRILNAHAAFTTWFVVPLRSGVLVRLNEAGTVSAVRRTFEPARRATRHRLVPLHEHRVEA